MLKGEYRPGINRAIIWRMPDTLLRLGEVPVSTLGAFMEAAAAHPTNDLTQLASFAGFSASTARKAVPTLETLGIVKRADTGP